MQKQVTVSKLCSMITDDCYDFVRELGEGSFACVSQYQNKQTQEYVAIKHIYVQRGYLPEVLGEVESLKSFENDHIIKCKDSFYDSEELYLNIVMELCQSSLREQIKQKKPFYERQLRSFIAQMTSAFLELDAKMVMHLDFKPQNILVARVGQEPGSLSHYKIADFGCAQIAQKSKMSGYEKAAFGTLNYLAPQNPQKYTGKKTRSSADVWSLGVTLYQMIYWKLPFPTDNNGVMVSSHIVDYLNGKGPGIEFLVTDFAPTKIIELVKRMLQPKPTDRITWKKIQEYLQETLGVEPYEFDNISKTCDAAIPNLQLFGRVLNVAEKQEKKEMYEGLVSYLSSVGAKFRNRVGYKFWQLDKETVMRVERALSGIEKHEVAVNGGGSNGIVSEIDEGEPETAVVNVLNSNGKQTELVRTFGKELERVIEWDRCVLEKGLFAKTRGVK